MSASQSFEDFVRRQQEQSAASKAFDYEGEKHAYLDLLNKLYEEIRAYLGDYLSAGTVRLESSTIQLNEEGIGTYDAPSLIIIIGNQQITLAPVGTLLIGSKGRVDVSGSAGKVRLTLVDRHARGVRDVIKVTVNVVTDGDRMPDTPPTAAAKEIDWTWKIVSPPPSMTFIELDKESFLTMILEISGG